MTEPVVQAELAEPPLNGPPQDGQPVSGSVSPGRRGHWVIRVTALVIATVPISVLGVASLLEPNTSGLGTHQQLGLPPCSVRLLFGIRCPGCGMTTSWAHFARGQFGESARVNTGGFLLAIFSCLVAFLSFRTFWTARLPSVATQQYVTLALVSIGVVTALDWLMRLFG